MSEDLWSREVDEEVNRRIEEYFTNKKIKTRKMIPEAVWQTREEFEEEGKIGNIWFCLDSEVCEGVFKDGGWYYSNELGRHLSKLESNDITHVMPRQERPQPPEARSMI